MQRCKMNNYKKVSKILWIILVANVLVTIVKLMLGFYFEITSLLADGFHSIIDSISNVIGLIGVKLASRPADKKHPYGHYKIETLMGLFFGTSLLLITINIIYKAITWFQNPIALELPLYGIIGIISTLFINIIICTIEIKKGKKLNSEVLILDGLHTRSDCFITGGVILALVLIKMGLPSMIDPIISLAIAIFIFLTAIQILRHAIKVLIDSSAVDEEDIKKYILMLDSVILEIHKFRSRGKKTAIYIDFHIVVKNDTTVEYIHFLSHKIESELEKYLNSHVEIMLHVEPEEERFEKNTLEENF